MVTIVESVADSNFPNAAPIAGFSTYPISKDFFHNEGL
jgi:hypothetical protein